MAASFVAGEVNKAAIVMFSKTTCGYCTMAKNAFKSINEKVHVIEINNRPDCNEIQNELQKITGARSVPRVFINQKFFGGGDETAAAARSGELKKLINEK